MKKSVLIAVAVMQIIMITKGHWLLPSICLAAIAGLLGMDLWQKKNDYK